MNQYKLIAVGYNNILSRANINSGIFKNYLKPLKLFFQTSTQIIEKKVSLKSVFTSRLHNLIRLYTNYINHNKTITFARLSKTQPHSLPEFSHPHADLLYRMLPKLIERSNSPLSSTWPMNKRHSTDEREIRKISLTDRLYTLSKTLGTFVLSYIYCYVQSTSEPRNARNSCVRNFGDATPRSNLEQCARPVRKNANRASISMSVTLRDSDSRAVYTYTYLQCHRCVRV